MTGQPMDPRFRIVAGVLGAAGAAALIAQVGLNMARDGAGVLATLWALAGFFTILTNTLVAVTFLRIAVTGQRPSYDWMSMLTVAMIMVAGVYHVMLAHLYDFSGLNWWTDQMFHTVMPALTVWFWLMETTRSAPRAGRPVVWLAWPAAYAVYMLARGAATGWYPYPFMNPLATSWGSVVQVLALFVAGAAVLALAAHALGRAMPLRRPPGTGGQ
ncbi:MAG: Pr6Pr family membrane protein [Rhodobacteraceae bacterium]|nr:Pr6Pr family membrane protein [Paracoccaceae bacterium]